MKPIELRKLARDVRLDDANRFELRVAFGIACIERVEHLLTDSAIIEALSVGKRFRSGDCSMVDLSEAATVAASAARSHAGSNSLDGSGSGAVSTSYGVAAALGGRALEAAEYAAYASVYSYAGYAATDPSAYTSEHAWQIKKLQELTSDQR